MIYDIAIAECMSVQLQDILSSLTTQYGMMKQNNVWALRYDVMK